MLIEIRLELKFVETETEPFFGLVRDDELFFGRLERSDEDECLCAEVVFRRPSLVPITDPDMTRLPETDVPVGDEPERLFPEEPGLKRGGGGGGPFSDRLELIVANGNGSGHVPVPLDELEDVFRTFFRIRPAFRLFAEWLLRTMTPLASFSSFERRGGGGGDLK